MAYTVGANFMTVYALAANTIMHCYCVDEELHKDKGLQQAAFAPEALKDFVNNHIKKPDGSWYTSPLNEISTYGVCVIKKIKINNLELILEFN